MITVRSLVWDTWNRQHLSKHSVSPQEVIEVIKGKIKIRQSYRKRLLVKGTAKSGRQIVVVLSPEDRNLKSYSQGTYYVITAFEITKEAYEKK